jgi:hypothetical protein
MRAKKMSPDDLLRKGAMSAQTSLANIPQNLDIYQITDILRDVKTELANRVYTGSLPAEDGSQLVKDLVTLIDRLHGIGVRKKCMRA